MANLAPYSRVTTWTRVVKFWDWLITQGHQPSNPYRAWRSTNARLFRHVYVRAIPKISFDDAKKRIASLPDVDSRAKANDLLQSAMRFTESATYAAGQVVGKGGKPRQVFLKAEPAKYVKSYETLRRHLATIGLKPHDLRKIRLAKLVEDGASIFDLMAIAGWSSAQTATSYIESDPSKLRKFFKR